MKKKIISFFKSHPGSAFRSKEVAKKLSIISDHEYSSLKAFLHKLYEEEFLIKSGKRYKLNFKDDKLTSNRLAGVLEINQGGYGFVVLPGKSKSGDNAERGDIFIASRNLSTAFHGDTVEVVLFARQKGKNIEGQIVKVLNRNRSEIVGTLTKSKSFFFIK